MKATSFCQICWIVCVLAAVANADDLSELREAARQSQGEGLKSLIGHSIVATKTEYGLKGEREIVIRQQQIRGSFRSVEQWFVRVSLSGSSETQSNEAVVGRNGRLVYWGTGIDSASPVMTNYGFDWLDHGSALYSAETYCSSITSGGNLFDVSFYSITCLDSFNAERVPSDDSVDVGRCWKWSTEARDEVPAYVGKIWIHDFGSGRHVIGKLKFQVQGSEKSVEITNQFSSSSANPTLIERVEIDRRGQRESFALETIANESESVDGYRPERFGLVTPVDPARGRLGMWLAAAAFGSLAVYLTIRWRNKK